VQSGPVESISEDSNEEVHKFISITSLQVLISMIAPDVRYKRRIADVRVRRNPAGHPCLILLDLYFGLFFQLTMRFLSMFRDPPLG